MYSYHARAYVCVGSFTCCAQATPLSKLQWVTHVMGRGFETRRTGRWGYIKVVDTGGGFIFVSEVPVSSTQFLLRVGRAT